MKLSNDDRKKIENLGVKAVVLFGSQAQGVANEISDYDFFIIGPKKKDTYDVLYDILSDRVQKLTDIDIVFESEAPMELKNHVVKYGKILYEKSPSVFADFKQNTMIEYSDFAPHRTIFSNATIARIN